MNNLPPLDLLDDLVCQQLMRMRFMTYLKWVVEEPLVNKYQKRFIGAKNNRTKLKLLRSLKKEFTTRKNKITVVELLKYGKRWCTGSEAWHELCNLSAQEIDYLYGVAWKQCITKERLEKLESNYLGGD